MPSHIFKMVRSNVTTRAVKALFLCLSLTLSLSVAAGNKTVRLGISEQDVKIYVDGKLLPAGQVDIVVPSDACVTVKVEKAGFLNEKITFCNKPNIPPPPKTYNIEMKKDDAYEASEPSDMVNRDIEITTHKPEAEAWKLITRIITTYFDDIEVINHETGYLLTSWKLNTFKQNTVRTRLIVKPGTADPWSYRIKLASEESGTPVSAAKSEENFKEWNRVLKQYKDVIQEIREKLGS